MLVSCVVPLYNLGHVLPEAVHSLTGQTYRKLEIIIVNDGSTDDSGVVADRLATEDQRVRVIHQENQGLPGALNVGFSKARGKVFNILSADDLLHPESITKKVELMQQTGADVVNEDMAINGESLYYTHRSARP